MYSIRLQTGEFLDVPIGLTLPYELNNQVFSTSSTDVLPGSFTFPVDLPGSDLNRRLLNNPQLEANAYNFREYPDTSIYCHGVEIFRGTLKILSANRQKIKVSIIAAALAKLKNVPLNQLDLGGERGLGGHDENLALFAATAERPDDYDFAFFPVYCPFYDAQSASVVDNDYINWWRDDEYTFSVDSVALIPFPRIDYLLRRIFENQVPDFTFINEFQRSRELRRMYLLNNFDSRIAVGSNLITKDQIDLKNHVGEMPCNDFLRGIMARFCLGLFSTPFQKRILLRPLRDIVIAPALHDWSPYVIEDSEVTNGKFDTPLKFCDPQFEGKTALVDDAVSIPSYSSHQAFQSALPTLTDGLYYVEATETVYQVTTDSGLDPLAYDAGRKRRCIVFGDAPEFEATITPCGTHDFPGWGHFPWYEQTGSYWENENPDGAAVWARKRNSFDPQIALYRGFQESVGAVTHDRPYASNDVWRPDAAALPTRAKITDKAAGPSGAYTDYGPAEYSLLWGGPYGLYKQWWEPWHNMLMRGKHIKFSFALPIASIISFSFEQKVRVQNIDYIVKRLQVTQALSGSRMLVEADLISMI